MNSYGLYRAPLLRVAGKLFYCPVAAHQNRWTIRSFPCCCVCFLTTPRKTSKMGCSASQSAAVTAAPENDDGGVNKPIREYCLD